MKRLYLIVPLILLGAFSGIYWQHSRATAVHAAEKAAAAEVSRQAEEAKKAEAARQARADADRRAAERLVEEQKREAAKRARFEEDGRLIADDTARYNAKVAELTAENAKLEQQLIDLRSSRETLNKETFALAREIELARIAKRNAELEIVRLTAMVARQAGNTTLARPPL